MSVHIKITESVDAKNARLEKEKRQAALFTVHWTSAMSGNRRSSTCNTKAQAIREARELFVEGARYISISKFSNGSAIEINWKKI